VFHFQFWKLLSAAKLFTVATSHLVTKALAGHTKEPRWAQRKKCEGKTSVHSN